MFHIIIVSHGNLASAFYETAQMIVGNKSDVQTFGLQPGDDIDTFASLVETAIEENLLVGDVLVLTDIQTGSPCNVTVAAMVNHQFRHITGINLAMVVEALGSREFMKIDEVCESILEIGRDAVRDINKLVDGIK